MSGAVSAPVGGTAPVNGEKRRKEIYTYQAPWTVYGLNWSCRPDQKFRLAIGSFIEEYCNKVQIIQLDEDKGEFVAHHTFDHPYPTTKIMWNPSRSLEAADLLGTTGDYMRLWTITDNQAKLRVLLNNNKSSEFCAPITSFDWNEIDNSIIGTSSIDTTCTIWNVETQQAKTQLIAHDKEVYDIAFMKESTQIFASCGADGSVRMFDLRTLQHSTIIFETPEPQHLLRLAWNKQDGHYLGTIMMDSSTVIILDIRVPSVPVAELSAHTNPINSLAWAPHSSCHLATAGDDSQALIWDLSEIPNPIVDPILSYNAAEPINQLQWSAAQNEWIAIAFGSKIQILRV